MHEACDLLLLNASNYSKLAVFPYAFVQVSAIARRYGVSVRRFDFLDVRPELIEPIVDALLARHSPRLIGLHLRQADTLYTGDYPREGGDDLYLPVEATKALIQRIRARTSVPVILGGFALSIHPVELVEYLQPDFAVQGEPDDFFAKFEEVMAGRHLETVDNLVYRSNGTYQFNPRRFYDPSPEPEYTPEIIQEIKAFYGRTLLDEQTGPRVALEVSRGCPFRCYFCTEPHVKGTRVRMRHWDAIRQDIELLSQHHLTRLWFVCSELNAMGPKFPLEIAARMAELNADRSAATRVTWQAYNLPTLKEHELRTMMAAGFRPGWNDFPSFDDDNLKRCKVPYRARHAVEFLSCHIRLARQLGREADREFNMFLGNAFADAQTVSSTLRAFDRAGFQDHHAIAAITQATRVFRLNGALICDTDETAYSVDRGGKRALHVIGPTFQYPKDLMQRLGSADAIEEFFAYVGRTFCSVEHRAQLDANEFLARSIGVDDLSALLATLANDEHTVAQVVSEDSALGRRASDIADALLANPEPSRVRALLFPDPWEKLAFECAARLLLTRLFVRNLGVFAEILDHLGVPHDAEGLYDLSEYRLSEILYAQYNSNDELVAETTSALGLAPSSCGTLQLKYFLYENGVRIVPAYRALLFGPDSDRSGRPDRAEGGVVQALHAD